MNVLLLFLCSQRRPPANHNMIYELQVAAYSLCHVIIMIIFDFFKLHLKHVRLFYISFVQSCGQWQRCVCQRHISTVNWIAIVL